jgi:CBS domain-containing protein
VSIRTIPDARLVATPVREVMTTEVVTGDADASLDQAAHAIAINHVRRLPALHGAQLVGILRFGNLEQAVRAHGASAEEALFGVMAGP